MCNYCYFRWFAERELKLCRTSRIVKCIEGSLLCYELVVKYYGEELCTDE